MGGAPAPLADMRTEYGNALEEVGAADPRVVVLGADTTDSLKTAGFGRRFPGRFFNVGIAEANMVSVAAGLAASGKTAFASTYATFVPGRAVDQIRNAVCYPTRGGKKGLNVKLVVSHGGLSVGADGGSHQQLEDIATMRAMPNMRVMIPADARAVAALTRAMAREYGPFYMRMARPKTPVVHGESQEFEAGRGIVVRDGSDCTIAACGTAVAAALEAARVLEGRDGVSCRVIDVFSVKPIDAAMLEKAAAETGAVATCEEHNVMGGMGSAVAEEISQRRPVPVVRVGVRDAFGESCRDPQIPQLLEKHGMSSVHIADAALRARRLAGR